MESDTLGSSRGPWLGLEQFDRVKKFDRVQIGTEVVHYWMAEGPTGLPAPQKYCGETYVVIMLNKLLGSLTIQTFHGVCPKVNGKDIRMIVLCPTRKYLKAGVLTMINPQGVPPPEAELSLSQKSVGEFLILENRNAEVLPST